VSRGLYVSISSRRENGDRPEPFFLLICYIPHEPDVDLV